MDHSSAGGNAAPGALIGGRYRIESLIGRGGMAAVYRAKDESLGRSVAVKLFASDGAEADALKRETSEIRLLASMNHHALVTLFDASVDGVGDAERAFLVMELVEGPTLQKRIEQSTVAAGEVALMAADLAEALHVVHAQGVVHRDIKPANILLSPTLFPGREFRAKLADFGIAYLIDSTRLTTPGTLIGTAAYLSPEQADGSAPGPAADIYSLGLVLLEALTGVRAFPGTLVESLTARLVRGPEIPGSLGYEWKSLLTAMTAINPASRPSALTVVDVARSIGSAPADVTRALLVDTGVTAAQPTPTRALATDDPTAALDTPTAVFPQVQPTAATAAFAPTGSEAQPTARLAPEAQTAATAVAPVSEPTSVTELFANAAPAAATSTTTPSSRPAPSQPASSRPATPRPASRSGRTRIVILVVAVILLAIAVVAVALWLGSPSTPAPTLPTVDGELGTHLEELMESVTP
jgi:serine/threonine protein kinase